MSISREEANNYIGQYFKIKDSLTESSGFIDQADHVKKYYNSALDSFVFTRDRIEALWQNSQVNAIRIYYGADTAGSPTVVLVGCNVDGAEVINVKLGTGIAADETPLPPIIRKGPVPKFPPYDVYNDDHLIGDNQGSQGGYNQ